MEPNHNYSPVTTFCLWTRQLAFNFKAPIFVGQLLAWGGPHFGPSAMLRVAAKLGQLATLLLAYWKDPKSRRSSNGGNVWPHNSSPSSTAVAHWRPLIFGPPHALAFCPIERADRLLCLDLDAYFSSGPQLRPKQSPSGV